MNILKSIWHSIATRFIPQKLAVSLKEKYEILTNKIRIMIFETLKKTEGFILSYFYIEIRFSTIDGLNNYKLPLIGHMIDFNDALLFQQTLISGLMENKFVITSIPNQPQKIKNLEKTKSEIIASQEINDHNTIKFILEKIKLENGQYTRYVDSDLDKSEFKVNIIGNERIPFSDIKDLFVVRIDKEILE